MRSQLAASDDADAGAGRAEKSKGSGVDGTKGDPVVELKGRTLMVISSWLNLTVTVSTGSEDPSGCINNLDGIQLNVHDGQ